MSVPDRTLLPLPPYGRELCEARRRGLAPNVFIHAGDRAWARARVRRPPEILCLPPEAEPENYDWRLCHRLQLTLVVHGRDAAFIDRFARLLVSSGAALVAALSASDDAGVESVFYRPEPR